MKNLILFLFVVLIISLKSFAAEFQIAASDTASDQRFGQSVDINGDYIIVGAPNDFRYGGAAYIFYRNQGGLNNWGLQAKVVSTDSILWDADKFFGNSVAIDPPYVVVGQYKDDANGAESGSIYIFHQDSGGTNNWGPVTKISASDGVANDNFGMSVSIYDTTVVVGSVYDDHSSLDSAGSVYIYTKNQGGDNNWGEAANIVSDDATSGDAFGASVSIYDTIIVVGAPERDENGEDRGATYIFYQNEGGSNNWGQFDKKLPIPTGVNFFGKSVDIDASSIVVGSPRDDSTSTGSGAAYIYYQDQGGTNNWGLQSKVKASDAAQDDALGESVAISGDYVVISTVVESNFEGAVYSYLRSGSTWSQVSKTKSSDIEEGDWFGFAVAIDGDYAIFGAGFDSLATYNEAGSAYIYESISDLSLPVELISFSAINSADRVNLNWTTESEIENLGFYVYRSILNKENYSLIGSYKENQNLVGNGNSASNHEYSFIDRNVKPGNMYWYKLVDESYTGVKTEYKAIKVFVGAISKTFYLSKAYPNPFNPSTNFEITLNENSKHNFRFDIYNILGQQIYSNFIGKLDKGKHKFNWNGVSDSGTRVTTGIYYLVIRQNNSIKKVQRLNLIK